jgi:hypothetical protein
LADTEDQKPAATASAANASETTEPISLQEFFETIPPTQGRVVTDLCTGVQTSTGWRYHLETPPLLLHCAEEACNGLRIFRAPEDQNTRIPGNLFIKYLCSNCLKGTKLYAIHARPGSQGAAHGVCYKYGELPVFGPPTPTRLLRLFGADREIFLRGRRCENQGLGIGAFVYYRRVVESHKNQILDEIIRVAQKIGASAELLATLERAKEEIQFSKAMAATKDAIPQMLLIEGQNPLTLLHSALSIGLHDKSDEECLEIAQSVRAVLVELADRISQALKDEAELKTAVSHLMKVQQQG